MNEFWETELEPGYYDKILSKGIKSGKGIQANWHNITLLNVQKYITKNCVHLDYACGPGTLIGKYSEANSLGVDIAQSQIEYAINKYGEKGNFLTKDNFSFNNYENYFDIVTVLGLFEFLNDREIKQFLDTAYLSLKKGGKLIITTPNFNSIIYPVAERLGLVNWSGEHKNKFNKKKLEHLLEKSDFKNISIRKILNFGMLTSFISVKIGILLENFFKKILFESQGFVIFAELEK
jgi:2-polyprenyl-3-methyl-5-hydroxy-6-metoxy-1,4-benzoquinol methylase